MTKRNNNLKEDILGLIITIGILAEIYVLACVFA